MQYSQAKQGRVFIIRLEDGDIIHETIEQLAKEEGIHAASLLLVGGADKESTLVVGPQDGRAQEIAILTHQLNDVHEILGTGTLFPNSKGEPSLHMHTACGRDGQTVTGCIRTGVKTWHVLEIILTELVETSARRTFDPGTGFELLTP